MYMEFVHPWFGKWTSALAIFTIVKRYSENLVLLHSLTVTRKSYLWPALYYVDEYLEQWFLLIIASIVFNLQVFNGPQRKIGRHFLRLVLLNSVRCLVLLFIRFFEHWWSSGSNPSNPKVLGSNLVTHQRILYI